MKRLRHTRQKSLHKSFVLSDKYSKGTDRSVKTGALSLMLQSLNFFAAHWKVYVGLSVIYLLILWAIMGLPSQAQYINFRELIATAFDGDLNSLIGIGTLTYGVLSGVVSPEQSDTQRVLNGVAGIIFWLTFIWATRYLQAGNQITIRQALYNSTTPLVSLLVIIFIIVLQIIPASIGVLILTYSLGGSAIAISGAEAMLFSISGFLLILITIYWVIQSLFASIVVTLPDTYPLSALRSAKVLVTGRRLSVFFRLLVFVTVALLAWVIVMIPVILIEVAINSDVIPVVPLAVNLISAFMLPVSIIFLYRLYRELL